MKPARKRVTPPFAIEAPAANAWSHEHDPNRSSTCPIDHRVDCARGPWPGGGLGAQDEPLVKAAKVQEKPHGLPPALEGQVDNWISWASGLPRRLGPGLRTC